MDEKKRQEELRDERFSDSDEPMTTREVIREVHGDPDLNLNDLSDREKETRSDREAPGLNSDLRQGQNWSPNDASAVRSGGLADMDDQTAGGAGLNPGQRPGSGAGLTLKRGVTGSDFDGQNASSSS